MQQQGQSCLAANGFQQYEVSAYSLTGRTCTHNLNYWLFGDYLGLGAGAHSKLTDTACGRATRSARHRIPGQYLQKAGSAAVISRQQCLDRADLILEFMLNALRLNAGFTSALFRQRTGLPVSVMEAQLLEAEERQLLERDWDRIRPTANAT